VPVHKFEEIEEESDEEKTRLSKSHNKSKVSCSRVLDEESSDDSPMDTTIMDMSKIAKLKVVKGIIKNRAYKLQDNGYTNIEA
jgi:hypothetical protein